MSQSMCSLVSSACFCFAFSVLGFCWSCSTGHRIVFLACILIILLHLYISTCMYILYFALVHVVFNRCKLLYYCWFRLYIFVCLRVRAVFHKTVRVCHVYCNFKIGFTSRITVIFGTLKDGSLLINNCFSYRNMFQNGVDALSKIVDAFLSKCSKFYLVG